MAAYGDILTATSSSNSTEAFCTSSDSSSFQPIKTQVTIPTAHVMPSMLDSPSCKLLTGAESSTPQTTFASSLPVSFTDAAELEANRGPDIRRPSQVFPRGHLFRASEENGFDQFSLPITDHTIMEDAQKSTRLDQPACLDRRFGGPWSQLQMCNSDTPATDLGKEPCMVQFSAKPTADINGVSEKQVSFGLNPGSIYSNSTASQPQIWRQEACVPHTHESCTLNSWKQHLDHVQLQLGKMQLQNKAACYHPLMNNTLVPSLDPVQWVSIVNTNENLLREREILIDRQRQHISQLEQKVRESELQVHNAVFGHPSSYGDIYLLRMQELQRENIFLRAQFTEKTEALSKEKIELERKQAASEAGVKQIQEAHKETVQKHTVDLKKQEERVKARDKHIEHLKKKCQKESEQNREKQQRIETLERYLADLPVLEDHRKQSQQLQESQQATAALQETVMALERQLGDVRDSCREKEQQLEMQKHKELELLSTLHSLQNKMQCGKTSAAAESYGHEMEKERREKDSLQKECDLLRKIVDNQKKKMNHLFSQIKDLEEQIAQEEGTSQAMRVEAMRQESALQQLHTAVKELSAQNQELIEKNLTLQENPLQLSPDQLQSSETVLVSRELHSELASCLKDLQSVYSVVTQRAQGKDPNLSLLLGIHTTWNSFKEKDDLLNTNLLAKKLEDVKQLRKEIEDLRTAISDRYAQDMGDNCITQ